MLKRKIHQELLAWKESKKKKCLVLQGARQVGKTFSVREFAKTYDEFLEINFKETPKDAEIFSGNLKVDELLFAIKLRYPGKKLTPGKTLIFLDEIQECEQALTSLKFWTQDGRFDVIASGSLLGIDYKRASSYPVGYVSYLLMYGLDFEEFLWSQKVSDNTIAKLKELFLNREPVPSAIHSQMMMYFRLFLSLGGMPEVVWQFASTNDLVEADKVQRELLQGYLYDIAHYATAEEKAKAEKCFLSLAGQLLDKENHKFQYKEIEKGARAQKYYSSIEWLLKADIIRLANKVTSLHYDLKDYAQDNFFRAYTSDLSLLIAMKDFSLKQRILENTLLGNTKGGLYECAVADLLIKKGYPMFFYKNETTKKEIDFLIQRSGKVIPIEVKSGSAKSISLSKTMKEEKGIDEAYRFTDGNVGTNEDNIITMPLYMAMFL